MVSEEAILRYPAAGSYDGQPGTRGARQMCDGDCGCEACLRAWLDSGFAELIGTTWRGMRTAQNGSSRPEDVGLGALNRS